MGSRKLVFLLAVQLYLESSVLAQCIQVPQSCGASLIQPVTQFVIPAVIKPLIQETCVQSAPNVPSNYGSPDFGYSGPGFGGFLAPYGGMPPIIYDDSDDGGNRSWLYLLILLLSRRFGGGCGGYGGGIGGGCGGGCGCCCGGGCGCCYGGGCRSGSGGGCGGCCGGGCCRNCGGYGNGGCGCGGGGSGGCGNCGGCNGNGCGCGCTYLPYPVPYQPYLYNSYEVYENEGGNEVTYPASERGTPEINLIVKTDSSTCS